jgi:hypothetical protein
MFQIDSLTDRVTGAQGTEYRAVLRPQLAELDQHEKVPLIIPSPEALADEEKSCR